MQFEHSQDHGLDGGTHSYAAEPGQLWSHVELEDGNCVLPLQFATSVPPVEMTNDNDSKLWRRYNRITVGGVKLGMRSFKVIIVTICQIILEPCSQHTYIYCCIMSL